MLTVRLWYRARREHRIFQKLLGMVPHLLERLVDSSSGEDSLEIADLVRLSLNSYAVFFALLVSDSERYLQRQIRRHEKYERHRPRLDNAS